MSEPILTLLYVPADRPDRIAKALASGADGVVVDLEDAVAPSRKASARDGLRSVLEGLRPGVTVQVRVNAVGTPWHEQDLAAVAGLPVGVRIPKAESAEAIAAVAARVPGHELHPLIESALGVERAFEVASAPQVATLGLGETDLKADLGATDAGLGWVRGRIVNAARAAGLPAPLMSAFTHVTDLAGLADSCREGRALGFRGRSAIHPNQLTTIREAFLPTADEVARARLVLERLEGAIRSGRGALQLPDGTFIDLAMGEQARETLALATRREGSGH